MNPQAQSGFADAALYDPAVALEFFRSAGKPEVIAQGATIFSEQEREIPLLRRNKMYLLLRGEVGLLSGLKPIGRIRPGEIFGEMAVISHAPRSAAAVARTPCSVIALDDQKFEIALRKRPLFALMLMSVLIHRLRDTIARLKVQNALSRDEEWEEAAAFDPQTLQELVQGLADDPPVYYRQGSAIVTEGQKGLRMYAVLEGRVSVSIGARIVERLGPGGVFGEAALLDPSATRIANAHAESDSSLLPITREAFLALVKLSPDFADTMLSSLAERLRFLTARLN